MPWKDQGEGQRRNDDILLDGSTGGLHHEDGRPHAAHADATAAAHSTAVATTTTAASFVTATTTSDGSKHAEC